MRVLPKYGWLGDVERMGELAARLPTVAAEVRVCAPPDRAELPARVGALLEQTGVWR